MRPATIPALAMNGHLKLNATATSTAATAMITTTVTNPTAATDPAATTAAAAARCCLTGTSFTIFSGRHRSRRAVVTAARAAVT